MAVITPSAPLVLQGPPVLQVSLDAVDWKGIEAQSRKHYSHKCNTCE